MLFFILSKMINKLYKRYFQENSQKYVCIILNTLLINELILKQQSNTLLYQVIFKIIEIIIIN